MCGGHQHATGSSTATDATTTSFPNQLYIQLTDAHCHIHDDRSGMERLVHAWMQADQASQEEQQQPAVKAGKICLMGVQPSSFLGQAQQQQEVDKHDTSSSTILPTYANASSTSTEPSYERTDTHGDWETVETLAKLCPDRVVPCFGLHPWFTHKYYFDSTASASAIIAQDADAAMAVDNFENLSLIRGPGVRGEMAQKSVQALRQQMMASASSPSTTSSDTASATPASTTTAIQDEKEVAATNTTLATSPADPKQHYASILGLPQSASADYLDHVAPKLPTPRPLGPALQDLWRRLKAHPTALLGEIGLDRTARVPDPDYQEGVLSSEDSGAAAAAVNKPANKTTLAVTSIEHQLAVVTEQLKMAAELDRAVSFHCVQAYGHWLDFLIRESKKLAIASAAAAGGPGAGMSKRMSAKKRRELQQAEWERHVASTLSDSSDEDGEDSEGEEGESDDGVRKQKSTIKATAPSSIPPPSPPPAATAPSSLAPPPPPPKILPPRLCMHSYGGSVDMIKAFLKISPYPKIYFSFSIAINGRLAAQKFRELILAVPDDRLLIESDYHSPDRFVDATLIEMAQRISKIKGWSIEETVERTSRNWHEFVYGSSPASS